MRVAIVGAGAAGMALAHLLDAAHEVTVFEREPVPGGHIRTIGRNVIVPGLDPGLFLDAGSIEFGDQSFPCFQRLMRRLEVPLRPVPNFSTLFRADGRRVLTVGAVRDGGMPWHAAFRTALDLLPVARSWWRFRARAGVPPAELYDRSLSSFLEDDDFGVWVKLLAFYGFSMPFEDIDTLGAAVALPPLRRFSDADRWYAIEGGTYVWIEKVLERFRGELRCGAVIEGVRRSADGVDVAVSGGPTLRFDHVVFASPPDQFLALVTDPSPDERARFAAHRGHVATALVHDDWSMYARRGTAYACEYDLFELPGGGGGYNALLDRMSTLPAGDRRTYGLAMGLDHEIDPARVILAQRHHVPLLTVEALRSREDILRHNGDDRTWHVGAWLDIGFHEGAIATAATVATALGGDTL